MGWVADVLVPISPFVMVIFIVWFVSLTRRAQERHRAELQKDLLTKFSSPQELSEFLKTDGGKLLMPVPERPRTPARTAGASVIVLVVGFGCLAAALLTKQDDLKDNLLIAALLTIAAGVGLLISAFVTQKLSRKWGEEGKTT